MSDRLLAERLEAGFRALIQAVNDGIVSADASGVITLFNPAAERMFGYAAAEVLGKPLTLLMPERYRAPHQQGFARYLSTRESRLIGRTVQLEGRRKDGTEFPVELSLAAWESAGETFFTAILRDVSARKGLEGRLELSEERFRLLIDGVRDYAIFMLDPQGRVMTWNSGAERIKGYQAHEILGKHFSVFYLPEAVRNGHPQEELAIARRQGHYEEEGPRVRKDGSTFFANVHIACLRDPSGNVRGFGKVTRDITRRMEIEDRLRKSEERSRVLIDQVTDYAIAMLDPEGRVLTWNQGAERIKGYKADEILGRPISVFYTPEDIAERKPEKLLEAAVARGSVQDEGWRVRKDGSRFWADVTLTALHDDRGVLTGFSKMTRDATRRRRAEEEVRQNAAEAARAYRELETFSYSVSHDLRAPLRAIDGFSKILQETLAGSLKEQEQHYFERIRSASQRMGELIDDLLSLSRVSRGDLVFQEVDLTAIAVDVAADLRKSAPGRVVEFVFAPGMKARGDERLLRILYENLLGNSWKFTAKHARARIEAGVLEQGGNRAFFVRDDGAGFDMTYSGKLFGAFQRLHDPAEFEGTGIGLATVHRIVQRHGGTLWGEGEIEKGATFYFTLST